MSRIHIYNEREKDSYSNQDILPERTSMNVHFKAPTDDYVKIKTFLQKGIVGRPDNTARRYLLFVLNSCERQSISVKVTDIYPVQNRFK